MSHVIEMRREQAGAVVSHAAISPALSIWMDMAADVDSHANHACIVVEPNLAQKVEGPGTSNASFSCSMTYPRKNLLDEWPRCAMRLWLVVKELAL